MESFVARDQREQALIETRPTQAAALAAYADYEHFLQSEIDTALAALRQRLGSSERRQLDLSQTRWLAWREAEARFIDRTWRNDAFGSSAGLSRQAYRSALLRERAKVLWQYMKDQPGP